MGIFSIVITSAVVGALISSLLSLFGQYLERRSRMQDKRFERESRRKELLLSKAIELALTRTELVKEIAFKTKKKAYFQDSLISAKAYYQDLELLLDTGDISEKSKQKADDDKKKIEAMVAGVLKQ